MVIVLSSGGHDAETLGWGLALPEGVFANLPLIRFEGHCRTADRLLAVLRPRMDARIIWVDQEPEYWDDTDGATSQ